MSPDRIAPKPAESGSTRRLTIERRVASSELLGARGELIIVHAGREYRLRLTQSGKLILTA